MEAAANEYVEPLRHAGAQRGPATAVLGVAAVLVAIVLIGLLGNDPQPAAIPPRPIADSPSERAAWRDTRVRPLPMGALRFEQPRRGAPARDDLTSRLRQLSWQVDPYET